MENPQQKAKQSSLVLESKLDELKKRERQREMNENNKEKQPEKETINVANEKERSEDAKVSNVDMKHKKKCLEEQNKQTKEPTKYYSSYPINEMKLIKKNNKLMNMQIQECNVDMIQKEKYIEKLNKQFKAGDSSDVNTKHKHKAAKKEEEGEKINIPIQITNDDENRLIRQKGEKATEILKTKPEGNGKGHLQHLYDAIMDKDVLTEEPTQSNSSEPIKLKENYGELMKMQKQELSNSRKPQDTHSHSTAKENVSLKSASTVQVEHIYEMPDVHLNSSAEYINEMECVIEQNKQLGNVTLHVAVTGSTGAGKSSFINAVRGLTSDDENAAPTGVTETTLVPMMYKHPTMPNVELWDLPGTGSPKFKAKKYLKEVKLETFDFFIIISSERFKENDIMLANAIKERKKLFYFLRSKIDNDIHAESHRKDFDEQKVLSHIREDCHRNLKDMDDPHVFLICSFELHKYDFQTFVDTLEKQLPDHKRDALILSLPIYSSKILEEKIEIFMKQTWSAAVASGSVAVVPVPGLSMACDAAILLGFFIKCYYAFGLDEKSIDKLSVRVNNPSLKAIRRSPLVVAIGQKKLTNKELSALTSKEAAVKFAWSMVPVVGSKKTAQMSYSTTLKLLRTGVQDLAETAREVLKAAGVTGVY
ncbi:interferon-inducible GTPase 5-like [Danio rerio]|uniref:Interferon-inducible GTPase 5-like n=1 Tax=Danio rerio TaxID=7955 RepID=A0A8M9PK25_DANRE|nr:interferon-inducible GTPase 5-like [Danio rerio]XP_021322591.1 interferon-inducible GTPase 5-like [Danio rerio]|eukprot:XP_005173582.1 interferon-inducible GTPase 5-like [Danio rerio]